MQTTTSSKSCLLVLTSSVFLNSHLVTGAPVPVHCPVLQRGLLDGVVATAALCQLSEGRQAQQQQHATAIELKGVWRHRTLRPQLSDRQAASSYGTPVGQTDES